MTNTSTSADARTVLHQGRYLALIDDNGWEYAERSRGYGVVAVLAVTEDDQLVLTEQYRPAVKRNVIDLPAGLAGDTDGTDGEELAAAAARELEEETGFAAGSLQRLTLFPTSPGLTSETVTLFVAKGLYRTGDGGGDASEQITVHTIPLARVQGWLRQQERTSRLIDPKVYVALYLCREAGRPEFTTVN